MYLSLFDKYYTLCSSRMVTALPSTLDTSFEKETDFEPLLFDPWCFEAGVVIATVVFFVVVFVRRRLQSHHFYMFNQIRVENIAMELLKKVRFIILTIPV